MRQASALMDSLLYGAIEAKEKTASLRVLADGERGSDMLSVYMGLEDDNGEPLSHEFIRFVSSLWFGALAHPFFYALVILVSLTALAFKKQSRFN